MSQRPSKRRQPRRFVPNLGRLEDRTVPSGNVAAAVFEGILYVVGGDDPNQIAIMGNGGNSVRIQSLDGTTLINAQTSVTLGGVNGGMHIVLAGGDDVLSISDFYAGRNFNISMGDGNNTLNINNFWSVRTSNFFFGSGNDTLNVNNSVFGRDTVFDTGSGNDTVHVAGSALYRDTFANGGTGSNTFTQSGTFFQNLVMGNFNNGAPPDNPPTPPVQTPPTAVNDSGTVTRGGTVTVNVAANDSAVSPATLNLGSITITGAPAFGTATVNNDGTITYTSTNTTTTATLDTFTYTIKDSNGKTSNAATVSITLRDATGPTITLSTTETSPTNNDQIPITITFNKPINGFDVSDFVVTNGTAQFLTPQSSTVWNVTLVPTGPGDVTITLPANVVTDDSGNPNTASNTITVTFDNVAPTATITTTATDPTTVNPIPFTVTFSKNVTGFGLGGLTITNGTASNFQMVDAHTYTFDVAPTTDGLVTVQVNAGAAQDAAGNDNTVATFSITSQAAALTPTISTTATDPTNLAVIPFTVTFNRDVTGFDMSDLTVTNGTVSNFVAVDGHTFTFDITPTADGQVQISIAAGAAMDSNNNQSVAANFSIVSDRTAPAAPVITGLDPNSDGGVPGDGITNNPKPTIVGTAEANSTVKIFADVGSGPVLLGSTTADASGNWSFTPVTILTDGTYSITATATDAAGNESPSSAAFSLTIDTAAPVPTVTTTATDPTNLNVIPFMVTFTKDVTGFSLSGITVTNGTASNLVMVDAHTYTFDVAPTANGLVTVVINANAAQDLAGNGNTTASFSITSDRLLPTITTTATDPTNLAVIPFTVTFNRDVTGFDQSDLTVTNGTVSNFATVDGHTFTFDVTPTADGLVTIAIPAGAAMDASNNQSAPANFSITSDRTAPAAPVITGLSPTSDTGTAGDGITNNPKPTIVGTAEANSTVKVFADVGSGPVLLGTTTADASGNWSFTPVTILTDGTYTITATATDAAGNVSPSSASFTLTIDTAAPTASLTTTAIDPSGLGVIPFTVTFSKDVTGFSLAGISVTNGTASNLVMVDAHTYTFDVTPTANGLVTVTVNADAAHDLAGNGNTSAMFSITSDRLFATITTTAADPTNLASIPFTVTFNRDVTGFDQSDVVVTNGTAFNFTTVDGHTFTFNVSPTADGLVTIMIPAGAAMDSSNNPSIAVSFSITSDRSAPAAPVITGLSAATDSGTLGDGVTSNPKPTIVGTAEANSTIQVFGDVGSGPVLLGSTTADASGNWSFTPVTILSDGIYTITATATDAAGNVSPSSANFTLMIDTGPSTPVIATTATDPTSLATIPFSVTFDENVIGFSASDIIVTNGTISNFQMLNGQFYTFDVTPMADGLVTVTVPAGSAQDAAGNTSVAATTSITSERFNPSATVTTTASDPTNLASIPFTVTWSEDVHGFTISGLTITNGTAANFAMVNAHTYTFDVSPTADGLVTVQVNAGAAMDAFNNTNAQVVFTITSDRTPPAPPAITGLAPGSDTGTLGDGITNESMPTITGTAEANSTVTVFANSGSGPVQLGTVVASALGAWSFTPSTALSSGTYTITATATDTAGNASTPSAGFQLMIDTTAPTPSISTIAPNPTDLAAIPFTVTFSEDVTGFTSAGLTVTNGTVSNFTMVNAHTYTFNVTPGVDGTVTVKVNAGAGLDVAGNGNLEASFDLVSDRTAPTGTVAPTGTGQIHGTAADATSGVSNVQISIFDGTHYWDGTGFNSTTEVFLTVNTSDNFANWSLNISATGTFTVHARITDHAGNMSITTGVVLVS